jgi:glutaredoxin
MRRSSVIALLVLAVLLVLYTVKKQSPPSDGSEWTVYGTKNCGWTVKQLDYMKKNRKPYRFVDCDKEECSGMEAFPTLVSPNGEKIVGFSEI